MRIAVCAHEKWIFSVPSDPFRLKGKKYQDLCRLCDIPGRSNPYYLRLLSHLQQYSALIFSKESIQRLAAFWSLWLLGLNRALSRSGSIWTNPGICRSSASLTTAKICRRHVIDLHTHTAKLFTIRRNGGVVEKIRGILLISSLEDAHSLCPIVRIQACIGGNVGFQCLALNWSGHR